MGTPLRVSGLQSTESFDFFTEFVLFNLNSFREDFNNNRTTVMFINHGW